MALYILRGAFILLVASVATLYVIPFQRAQDLHFAEVVLMIMVSVGVSSALVAADIFSREKRLSSLSGVFLGLIGGMVVAYALSFVIDLIGLLTAQEIYFDPPQTRAQFEALTPDQQAQLIARGSYLKLLEGVKVIIGLVTCYVGISLVMQTKDDFRFVIPYVEFARQMRGTRPTLLDSSVIIDGRIVDIVNTRITQGTLVVPKFILNELQMIADSPDKLRRSRGRRGLDVLQQLQRNPIADVVIEDEEVPASTIDQKLVALAESMPARIMTNDYNLSKIAELRGIDIVNLNDLAKAMRPVVLPGESITVRIVKPGETASQGVGYLEDGTMVVVEHGRQHLGEEVETVVTSTLQTSAGRMIFGRPEGQHHDEGESQGGDGDEMGQGRPSGRGPRRPA